MIFRNILLGQSRACQACPGFHRPLNCIRKVGLGWRHHPDCRASSSVCPHFQLLPRTQSYNSRIRTSTKSRLRPRSVEQPTYKRNATSNTKKCQTLILIVSTYYGCMPGSYPPRATIGAHNTELLVRLKEGIGKNNVQLALPSSHDLGLGG